MSNPEHGLRAKVLRAPNHVQNALHAAQSHAWLLAAKLDQLAQFQRLALLWGMGGVALSFVTLACFHLGLNFAGTAFAFLIVIVVISLLDSFISSAFFSALAVGFLNFFFLEPRYTFHVGDPQDLIALTAFLITSLAITGLVRRVRNLGETQREQARLLDLTTDAVFVRDANDVITHWNRGAEELYGWKREEALGKVTHQLLQTAFPAPLAEIAEVVSRTGRWEGELVHTTRSGARVSVASRWSRQDDERGVAIGTLESNTDITERKRSAEELQRSQVAIDAIPAFASRYSAEGRREFINERARAYHGVSIAEVETDQPWISVHPDDIAPAERAWQHSIATGAPFEMEMRFRRADGAYRWQLNRRVAHRDPSGKIAKWYGVAFDIEDQKRAEDALRRSEAYLAEAQKLSHTGSFGWNVSTGEIFWSEETYRIFGHELGTKVSFELVLGRVHPDDVALVRQVIDRAASDKQGFDFEHRLLMPDRSVKHLHVVAHSAPNGSDHLHFVGAVSDITARKETEQALRHSEQRYQSLFQAMAVSLWELDYTRANEMMRAWHKSGITDFSGFFRENPQALRDLMRATRVIDVNDQAVALFGRGSKEELLTNLEPYLPEESSESYIAAVVASIGGSKFSTEMRFRRLDGTIFDAHLTVWYSYDNKARGLAGIFDISARKQAFARLEASEQRYRHLFNHMPVALWQLNARGVLELFKQLRSDGVTDLGAHFDAHPGLVQRCMEMLIIEEVNEHTVKLLGGRNPSEFVGNSIADYFPENSPTFRRSMVSRYRGDPNYAAETKLLALDGRVVDVLYTASRVGPVSEPGMSLLGVIDITERKQAEEALRRSERRYQNMFQAMAVAFFEFDFSGARDLMRGLRSSGITDFRQHFKANPETVRQFMRATHIIDVNDHTVALVGRGSREALIGNVEPFWPEESTQAYAEVMLSALEGKRSFSVETPFRRADRSVFHGHFTVWYSADEPTRGLAGVIDITERKQAEEALRRSEQRYQNLFQAMAVAFFELDFSRVGDLLRDLRASGVTDFRQHFRENPGTVRQFMRATRVVDVNEQTIALFGQGSREGLRGSVEPFWPQESTQAYAEAILSSLERRRSFAVETPLCRVDGSVFDAQFTVWYSPDDPRRGLGAVIDITERKQAFLALERSEQRYRHLFSYMPIALAQLDARGLVDLWEGLRAEGVTDLKPYIDDHPDFLQRCMDELVITEANERMVQFHGLRDASELLGSSVAPAWQKRPDTFRRAMESRFGGVANFEEETQLTTRDGRVVDVLFTASRVGPIGEPGGSLIGFIDISERVRAFSALERSEQRYRHLFHNMPLALWQLNGQRLGELFTQLRERGVTDLAAYIDSNPDFVSELVGAMVVEEVNDHAVKMFGARDRSELIGPTHWLWANSMDTPRRAFEGRWRGDEFFQETTRLATRDGRLIDVLYTVARPPTNEGVPIALASMIDLTEQVRAQSELQRVRADFAHAARISMLGELTASIAHEVNQPLAAIAASGEASLRWLARPKPETDEVRVLTTHMVADARRASDIVARIRGMATRRVPEQALLTLDDIIREAIVFLRHEVESRGVTVSHFPASGSHKVVGDRTQLQQVVVNLAVNAMQAMALADSTSRNITIRTLAPDRTTLHCSVEDSGPGIAPQHITRLFDSFFTTKDTGMGMGLRICRSVIEAHGGSIAADNESALGGARFVFSLPVASAIN